MARIDTVNPKTHSPIPNFDLKRSSCWVSLTFTFLLLLWWQALFETLLNDAEDGVFQNRLKPHSCHIAAKVDP